MRELAKTQEGDGNEVGCGSEAASSPLGLLHQTVHCLDESVGSMIEHAAHYGVEVFSQGCAEPLERLQPAAPSPRDPPIEIGRRGSIRIFVFEALRRLVHGGGRASLATNARPTRWATRVHRSCCLFDRRQRREVELVRAPNRQ